MRKLMVALVAATIAAASQAASIKWGATGTKDYAGNSPATSTQITMYVFEITASQYNAYAEMSADALSLAVYNAYGTTLASADTSVNISTRGAGTAIGKTDHASGTTGYAAVLFIDSASGYVMGNVGAGAVTSSQSPTVGNLSTKLAGGSTATAWATASVPEPTSGLLMLLGMAGLALRRRRV